jgi:hypothetical protein
MKRLLLSLLLSGIAAADEPQVWTSRSGQTFTGDFLAVRPGKVFVRSKEKKIFAIPMAKLSDACLAEAGYLQEKLGAWARRQVARQAMDEGTANAVLMLEPEAIKEKTFIMVAKIREIDTGTKLKPEKGPKIKFTTEGDVACQADFSTRGPLVVKPDAVYCDATEEAEAVFSRNATMLIKARQAVPVQVKVMKGKIVGGFMASEEDLAKAREADGKVVEYEQEIMHQRMVMMEEQIRTGIPVSSPQGIQGEDGTPLVIAEHRFTPEEIEAMKGELSWLKTKMNPDGRVIGVE